MFCLLILEAKPNIYYYRKIQTTELLVHLSSMPNTIDFPLSKPALSAGSPSRHQA